MKVYNNVKLFLTQLENTVLYSGRRLTKFSRNCYRKTIFAPDNPTSHHTSVHGLAGLIPAACQVQHVSDGRQLTVRVISLKEKGFSSTTHYQICIIIG